MRDRDIEASVVFALSFKDHLVDDLAAAGVATTSLEVRRLADLRWLARLVRSVRTIRPDVIHVHSPALAPAVRVAARLRVFGWRRPGVVSTEHNAWPTYHPVTRWANAATAPLDDATLAVSDEVRRSVRPAWLRQRVQTLHHGIDTAAVRALGVQREAMRSSLGIRPDEVVVITIANFRVQKNYPCLLHAAAHVAAVAPLARFVAIGQGPLAAEVERLHRELGLGERMLLLGYRPDATAVLAAGDIFTLASDYEGLPVALMEALAHGLPVVATSVGGVAETIDDSCGLLVAPGDPEALADALLTVVRDAGLRRSLAVGAASASQRFDSRRASLTIEQVYRSVAPAHR